MNIRKRHVAIAWATAALSATPFVANAQLVIDGPDTNIFNNLSATNTSLQIGQNTLNNWLIVTNAGSFKSETTTTMGSDSSSNNGMLISGTNSTLQTDSLTVHAGSSGTQITVENNGALLIGESSYSTNGGITIGNSTGTAALNLNSQTEVETPNLYIGALAGETGSASIDDESSVNIAGDLLIGTGSSSNTLSILNGSEITVGDELTVGAINTSGNLVNIENGTLTINGNSTIHNAASNTVSVGSNGRLNLSGDLTLNDSDGYVFSKDSTLQVEGTLSAASLSDDNTVILSGSSAVWTNTTSAPMTVSSGTEVLAKDGALISTKANEILYLGNELSSSGNKLTLQGTNTSLNAQADIYVGNAGNNNSLLITSNATATIGDKMVIGGNNEAANNNNATTESGSTLTATSIEIGRMGAQNSLIIASGSTSTSDSITVGLQETASNNNLYLQGSNSTLTVHGNITIGKNGTENGFEQTGGTASMDGDFILGLNGSGHTAQVTGTNSILNASNLTIAKNSTGTTMTISDGAIVTISDSAEIATGDNAGGTLNVSNKAQLLVNNGMNIGAAATGNATLSITEQGQVLVGDALSANMFTNETVSILALAGTTNTATIVAANASISADKAYVGYNNASGALSVIGTNANLNLTTLHLGTNSANNSLSVTGGATAEAIDTMIGSATGANNNALIVEGSNTLFQTDTLIVGINGSSNTATVAGLATLELSDLQINASNGVDNALNINNGGTLFVNSDFVLTNYLDKGLNFNEQGTLKVSGELTADGVIDGSRNYILTDGASWNVESNLQIGAESDNNTLTAEAGSTITAVNVLVGETSNQNSLLIDNSELYAQQFIVGSTNSTGNRVDIENSGLIMLGDSLLVNTSNFFNIADNSTLTVTGDVTFAENTLSMSNAQLTVGGLLSMTDSIENGSTLTLDGSLNTNATTQWELTDLYVGQNSSSNTLKILGGAMAISTNGYVGFGADTAENKVLISGTDSSWKVLNDLMIGNSSGTSNSVQLAEGGSLQVGNNLTLTGNSQLDIDQTSSVYVEGNYTQEAAAQLKITADDEQNAGKLTVTGQADFQEATSIYLKSAGGLTSSNQFQYTLVEAGSLTNDLATLNIDSSDAISNAVFFIEGNNLMVTGTAARLKDMISSSDPQLNAVADEIDQLAINENAQAKYMRNVLQDNANSEAIMDAYYGEKKSSTPMHNVVNSAVAGFVSELHVRGDNAREREAATTTEGAAGPHVPDQSLEGWATAYGTWGDRKASGGFNAYDSDIRGFMIGADFSVAPNVLAGIAGGTASSSATSGSSNSDADTRLFALYTSIGTQDWFFDGSFAYGNSSIKNRLGSAFSTSASYKAKNMAFYVGGGKEIPGNYVIWTPKASLLANIYDQNGYTEDSDAVAREVDGFDAFYVQSSIGADAAFYMALGETTIKPDLRLHWLHEFNTSDETVDYRLVGGTGSYGLVMQAPESDMIQLGAGVAAQLSEYLEVRIDLDLRQGTEYSDHTFAGTLRYEF